MMNKSYFSKELMNKIGVNESEVKIINEVLEENNVFFSKSKDKIICSFTELLKVEEARANDIYNASMDIIKNSIKYRLKHPFN